MGVIAEFTIDSNAFQLGSILNGAPEMDIQLDRIIPASNHGIPYLWAIGEDYETFESIVEESPLIDRLTPIEQTDEGVLYRIDWEPDTSSLVQQIAESNIAVLEAYRKNNNWFFRLRFDSHEDLVEFNESCQLKDINYQLVRVYPQIEKSTGPMAFGLSQEQLDTLSLAVDRGYFNVPRDVTLADLASELGITPQATSERIRRATDKVLRSVVLLQNSSVSAS